MKHSTAANVLGLCPGCWSDPCETPTACRRTEFIASLPKIARLEAAAAAAEDTARACRKGTSAYYVRTAAWSQALLDLREACEAVEHELDTIAAAQGHGLYVVGVSQDTGPSWRGREVWWVHGLRDGQSVSMVARSAGVEALCRAVGR